MTQNWIVVPYLNMKQQCIIKDLQEPDRSCLISSFSGMSWMAALIFSLITCTALCHFRLQCRRSSSQSVDTVLSHYNHNICDFRQDVIGPAQQLSAQIYCHEVIKQSTRLTLLFDLTQKFAGLDVNGEVLDILLTWEKLVTVFISHFMNGSKCTEQRCIV